AAGLLRRRRQALRVPHRLALGSGRGAPRSPAPAGAGIRPAAGRRGSPDDLSRPFFVNSEGASVAPSDASPRIGLRGRSPRSNEPKTRRQAKRQRATAAG